MIEYRIRPAQPLAHLFEVTCRIAQPNSDGQVLALPAWIPGSYLVRDFARNIVSIRAQDDDGPVAIIKLDKQTWRAEPAKGTLEVVYEIYAYDESVRTAYLNESRGFFNGTSVFLRVAGQEQAACLVAIEAPQGDAFSEWHVATTLPATQVDARGFGRYRAENYADLIDYPVEMGEFDRVEFEVGGVPHSMALCGEHNTDTGRLASDLQKICEAQQTMFGGTPLQRYLFLTLVKTQGYGGLEHRDSSALICSRKDLPPTGLGKATPEYHRFLGLCSHEYFHLWNVKRIRPPAVAASDLAAEAPFRDLWAYEGITSYYDELMLLRAGVIEPQAFLDELAVTLTRVWRTPGRFRQSLAESSFDAWTKFYKQDENAPNAIISYYAKGAVVALCLDLQLRLDSAGKVSLDDVMRTLWRRHGSRDEPVPEHGIEAIVNELAGCPCLDFFSRYVHGTEDPPVAELLAAFGIDANLRARTGLMDAGGPGGGAAASSNADLGVVTAQEQGREIIKMVLNGRAAEAAGLQPGDELVAINRQRLVPGGLDGFLNSARAGENWQLQVFRDDRLLEKVLTLGEKPLDTWELILGAKAGDELQARRQAWWS